MASRLIPLLLWLGGSVLCLRDIQLSVPEAVGVGTSAVLGCRWSLDTGETLYTVKWYHGAQEFFRFVPKELPNTRVFSQTGISVDVSRSGAQQVVLRDACRSLSGRYRCEVSADAPFFHTVYKSAYMRVIDLPESPPNVHAQKSWYSVGDMLRANCSEMEADPPANLTWLINGQEVKGLNIPPLDPSEPYRRKPVLSDASLEDANRIIFSPWEAEELAGHKIVNSKRNIDTPLALSRESKKDFKGDQEKSDQGRGDQVFNRCSLNGSAEERSNKTSSFSQLVIRVQPSHFQKGRINVTCVSRVLTVWSASAALLLDEERPQIALVMGSRDTTSGFRSSKSQRISSILSFLFIQVYWSFR